MSQDEALLPFASIAGDEIWFLHGEIESLQQHILELTETIHQLYQMLSVSPSLSSAGSTTLALACPESPLSSESSVAPPPPPPPASRDNAQLMPCAVVGPLGGVATDADHQQAPPPDKQGRSRRVRKAPSTSGLSAGVKAGLRRWLQEHRDLPYPTKAEKQQLADELHVTFRQVDYWFTNVRRREFVTPAKPVIFAIKRRVKLGLDNSHQHNNDEA